VHNQHIYVEGYECEILRIHVKHMCEIKINSCLGQVTKAMQWSTKFAPLRNT
jgi:hypothetical protein